MSNSSYNKTEAVKDFFWGALKMTAKYALVLTGASLIFSLTGIGDISTGALLGLTIGTAVVDTGINIASMAYTKASNKKTEKETREAMLQLERSKDAIILERERTIADRDAEISRLQSEKTGLETKITSLESKLSDNKNLAGNTQVNVRQMRLIVTSGSVDVASATAVLDEIDRDQRTIRS